MIDTDALNYRIDEFERRISSLSPSEAESELVDILGPLFEADGYKLVDAGKWPDDTVNYYAYRDMPGDECSLSTCIEYKHYQPPKKVNVNDVRTLVAGAALRQYDRAILLSNAELTRATEAELQRVLPVEFQLMNLSSLRAWAYRIERAYKSSTSAVVQAVTELSRTLARLVAKNPTYLDEIEWRDMERMLATVFEKVGFSVELTPPAKDGGRDIILTCVVSGEGKRYFVEVKHWPCGKRVGTQKLKDFVHVLAREQADQGLYIATYGYASKAIEALSESERCKVRCGQETKVVSLCNTFVRAESAIWSPPRSLPELLFEDTM